MDREKTGLGLRYLLILKELSCKCYGEDILLASKEAKCQNKRIRPNFSIVYHVCHSSSWSLIYSQSGFSDQSQLKHVPACSPGTLGLMTTTVFDTVLELFWILFLVMFLILFLILFLKLFRILFLILFLKQFLILFLILLLKLS